MRFRGRNGHMTRVVSIYRPCHGNIGAASVHAQHDRYFKGKEELDRNPQVALYEDLLLVEVMKWKEEGDRLILAGDMIEDVSTGLTNAFFTALGLREVILERHAKHSPPATNKNNNSRQPIDGIWASYELEVTAAGYQPFGEGCESNHRLVWAHFHTILPLDRKALPNINLHQRKSKPTILDWLNNTIDKLSRNLEKLAS
jgi:hypothetical protein